MKPILAVENLTVRRGQRTILDQVNWCVCHGENWVILGANGSGKSSLLNVLGGYLHPTDGTAAVLGKTFGETDWRELRKRIGIVSAAIAELIHDEDPVLEIVVGGKFAMSGVWGRVSENDERAAARHLASLEAGHLSATPWMVLSQGERQRVLIARALMTRPRLLILDEPCSGLDPVARERFLCSLSQLAAKRSAPGLVLVTHHVEEITSEFSHALLISDGRVVGSGEIARTLTSESLSRTFGAEMKLGRRSGRYQLAQAV